MPTTVTLLSRGIPNILTSQIFQITVDSDSGGNISVDVTLPESMDTPTFINAAWVQVIGTNPSSPANWAGNVTVTVDNNNRMVRIRGRNFPASTTNITLWLFVV